MKFEELQNDIVSIKIVRNNIYSVVYAVMEFYFLFQWMPKYKSPTDNWLYNF